MGIASMPARAPARAARGVQVVRKSVRDGVATITINRPGAMNALNGEVFDGIADRFAEALADSQVKGIVLAGAGTAFVAGADLNFFIEKMEVGDVRAIRAFTERGHEVLDTIDRSPKTVVSRLGGLALGGGVELALASDYIVASKHAVLGFPETGIGIYPGLGGTQRTRERVGVPLTKYLIFTGDLVRARLAADMGLVDAVVAPDRLAAEAREWALERSPVTERRPGSVPERLESRAAFFHSARIASILDGEPSDDECEGRIRMRVRARAPLALRHAEEIIERGDGRPLAEALRLELSHLEDVFTSEDALEGMRSAGSRQPVFRGR